MKNSTTTKRFETFGKALSAIRAKRFLTQAKVASLAGGVHSQFISNAERGLCQLPTDAMKKLVKELRLSKADKALLELAMIADRTAEVRKEIKTIFGN